MSVQWLVGILYRNITKSVCVSIFSGLTQQTFQRCLNVGFWLIWCRDIGQREINVETRLCVSTLEFSTLNYVESMFSVSTLIWTKLGNVETTLSFSTSRFAALLNVETTLWKWPFLKRTKKIFQIEYTEFKVLTTIS